MNTEQKAKPSKIVKGNAQKTKAMTKIDLKDKPFLGRSGLKNTGTALQMKSLNLNLKNASTRTGTRLV